MKVPASGFKGIIPNFRYDFTAAISVSLVALPLALGIAYASNVPPMAGIVSAVIGGVVTTLFRGSHLAINGPAAGLIAVILSSLALWEGDPRALNYVLAAIVVAGGIQVLLGLLKLGKFAEIFHSTVIQGIMAAIGVIIFAKQIHVGMGTSTEAIEPIAMITDAIKKIPQINPMVGLISILGLLLLIFHSKVKFKLFHYIPAPMWVLIMAIPFTFLFNLMEERTIPLFGNEYLIGPHLLIDIPENLLDAITHPDFSKIDTWRFWSSVALITIIASIQTLAMGKAVDKLDPYKRKTDLNKDLVGIGISTMVSGALGGLPIITVIIRSTVNVHHDAKTKWSNMYHGILLALFVLVFAPTITKIPLAALAILLVYTGYKLASPKVFKHILDQGIEQFIFFVGTLLITLKTDLLIGIIGGSVLALTTHLLLARVTVQEFFRLIYSSGSNLFEKPDGSFELKMKGIANFLAANNLNKLLAQIPKGAAANIDFSESRLVDFSIQEKIGEFEKAHKETGGSIRVTGLEQHISSTAHRYGLKLLTTSGHRMTNREKGIQEIASSYGWQYATFPVNHLYYFENFKFFTSRTLDTKRNGIWSESEAMKWEIADITFEESAGLALEEYTMTVGLIRLDATIPKFTIERKDLVDRYIDLSAHRSIDVQPYPDFSKQFIVKVADGEKMDVFTSPQLKQLVESQKINYMESNGNAVLIFINEFRLAQLHEYTKAIKLMKALVEVLEKKDK